MIRLQNKYKYLTGDFILQYYGVLARNNY